MPKLKLTYFDFDGGRGETPRMALHIGGVPFEDDRIKRADWPAMKPTTPFGGLPVLETDGQVLAQSLSICRYVGKLAGLYPEDPLQAAYCDEALDTIEELGSKVGQSSKIKDEAEKKAVREALVEGPLTQALRTLNKRLEAHGGYFADGRLTVADLRVFIWMQHLRSGKLDYIPADLAAQVAPALEAHFERVESDPKVAAYLKSRGNASH